MTINETRGATGDAVLRDQVIRRLKKRRDFQVHLLTYVLFNAFLVAIWAISNLHSFFWPIFPILGWGVAVVLNAWDTYRPEEFTEEQIQREMEHLQRRG
jgi:hypothetical protein